MLYGSKSNARSLEARDDVILSTTDDEVWSDLRSKLALETMVCGSDILLIHNTTEEGRVLRCRRRLITSAHWRLSVRRLNHWTSVWN
ncbi:hypothetical protein E2C01_067425 [Portunus trituberculatus]|uniref:Uncharacterized protein n=1 Tax=Portunus trituberculatus TaxID=210409 RepID=A0A5B7HV01_PORTR|nr:hypothetical protein [Portunus trituberculatus]